MSRLFAFLFTLVLFSFSAFADDFPPGSGGAFSSSGGVTSQNTDTDDMCFGQDLGGGACAMTFDESLGVLTINRPGGFIQTTPSATASDCSQLLEDGGNGGANGPVLCAEDVNWTDDPILQFNVNRTFGGEYETAAAHGQMTTPSAWATGADFVNTRSVGTGITVSTTPGSSSVTINKLGWYRFTIHANAIYDKSASPTSAFGFYWERTAPSTAYPHPNVNAQTINGALFGPSTTGTTALYSHNPNYEAIYEVTTVPQTFVIKCYSPVGASNCNAASVTADPNTTYFAVERLK